MELTQFQAQHEALIRKIETSILDLTPSATTSPTRLHKAMRYSLESGGKRLRPVLCLAAAAAFDSLADATYAATAIECIHTYSLIHDDLPCMDNSDLRRGRLSCHKAFDEFTALLAGDALQPLAFELLAYGYKSQPVLAIGLVQELAVATGSKLLVGGQSEDMAGFTSEATGERLEFILLGKTSAMFSASCAMGAMIGGASASEIQLFRRAGHSVGVAFQLVDDLLDITGNSAHLGKPVGFDAQKQKFTYVGMYGIEATQKRIDNLTQEAIHSLESTRGETSFLVELVRQISNRRK